jgi:glycerol-3-phosphate O-acyltransferase
VFEPSVAAKKGDKSILMLTYYRNNLIHLFVEEALIATTLLGVSNIQSIQQGVPI